MSDEEKNVIDLLKNIDKQKCLMLNCPVVKNNIERQLKIIELNRIIRKQSKEIEELKAELEDWKFTKKYVEDNYVSKDKIKAKIEELDIQLQKLKDGLTGRKTNFVNKNMLFAQKEVLQLLLEKEQINECK